MKNWYAVQCKPNQDPRAEEHLGNQGFEVFRPRARVRRRYRGQLKDVVESLFPRYLFVSLDDGVDNWMGIRSTRGVKQLVSFNGRPARVPVEIIDQLQQEMGEQDSLDLTANRYQPNQKVRIVEGPFSGYEALFSSTRGEDRVIVLLNIMHQTQQLVFPEQAIEPA